MTMQLGAYTFAKDPQDCTMPVEKRRCYDIETFGGVAFFSWGAFIEGQKIKLKWGGCSTAQYNSLRTLLTDDAQIVWDPDVDAGVTTYNVEIKKLVGKYHMSKLNSAPYRKDVELELLIISEGLMALSLDATLKARMDTLNRRPIVEITSESSAPILPTKGNYFSSNDEKEIEPNIIKTSTGRMITVFVEGDTYHENIKFYYTDENKSEWKVVSIFADGLDTIYPKSASICELTDGNIGVLFTYQQSSTIYLNYMIVTPTGTVVTASTNIDSTHESNYLANPYVLTLANDTYLLVYSQGTEIPPDQTGDYYLNMRTSSNFTAWSAASAISLGALSVNNYKANPHLVQLSTGRVYLHFDYLTAILNNVEVNNIYGMYSDDNGSSWNTPYAITTHTEAGLASTHPSVAVKANDDMRIVYTERRAVRRLSRSMDAYPSERNFRPRHIDLNAEDGRVYIWAINQGEVEINIDDWEYVRIYSTDTSPSYAGMPYVSGYGDGKYTCVKRVAVWVTDMELETITHYAHKRVFSRYGGWEVLQNWDYDHGIDAEPMATCIYLNNGDERLYMAMIHPHRHISIGYFDLKESPDAITGKYTWHEIHHARHGQWPVGMGWNYHICPYGLRYDKKYNWLIMSTYACSSRGGGMVLMHPDTGNIIYYASDGVTEQFPFDGCEDVMPVEKNGIMYLYFTFGFNGKYDWEPEKRGLGRIRMDDNSIEYFEPTWYSIPSDYKLHGLIDMDGDGKRLLMTCCLQYSGQEDGPGGVAIFNTENNTWQIFNNNTLPGFLPSGQTGGAWGDGVRPVEYDPATGTIYAVYQGQDMGGPYRGLIAFNESGAFSIVKYADVINADTIPSYGTPSDFTYYDFEYYPSIVYDENDLLWGTWVHYSFEDEEYSLIWAALEGARNLEDFIDSGSNIEIKWDIEDPTTLSFTLANGHLFDPQNLLSIYSPLLRKGRKVKIRIGENISDTEYWQNQGTFIVKEVRVSYGHKYPKINVKAEDIRSILDETKVVASTYYSNEYPETILEDILLDHADFESSEFNIPSSMVGRHDISHQFIEMTVADMIKELLEHFMYYPTVDVDGIFEPRRLNLNRAIDASYPAINLVGYTPDDSYSTYVNRVIVKGMSDVFSEVLYEEDSITTLSGTIGWWGSDKDVQVWYSEDHERTCRNPRLEVIQSVSDFQVFMFKGGGGEWIGSIDFDEHYVIVHIDAPNLMGVFIGLCAALLITGAAALGCTVNCGWFIWGCALLANLVCYVLGAVASYDYVIWARPIGHEKRSFQAQADDYEFQELIGGRIVPVSFEDPFCYTVQSCQTVADNELAIVMAQRNRVKFDKVTHLQDEVGDKIAVYHPYSGEVLNTFIASLKRVIRVGKSSIDKIEGWRFV